MKFLLLWLFLCLYVCVALKPRSVPRMCAVNALDVATLPVEECFRAVCGNRCDEALRYPGTDVIMKPPTVCKFVIGNPRAFMDPENEQAALAYGFDQRTISASDSAETLAAQLPVVYVADMHSEFGTLGLQLNRKSDVKMGDLRPELRTFRDRRVYDGGATGKGSDFLMVRQKVGFPENRAWKGIPGEEGLKLFFSPDVAMANELCLTRDATPQEFKFFRWTTIWLPNQLELEYSRKFWITVKAPVSLIFDEDLPQRVPLWRRVVSSLPHGRIFPE